MYHHYPISSPDHSPLDFLHIYPTLSLFELPSCPLQAGAVDVVLSLIASAVAATNQQRCKLHGVRIAKPSLKSGTLAFT